jgi:GH15 family glucan-1,4-alpha-glucosidase
MAAPLEHYGLIGDTTTIGLISKTGSLDWLCLPRIDSDACVAGLLGNNQNGYWAIRPAAAVRHIDQHYRGNTMILETDVSCDGGRVRVIDFMTPGSTSHDVIRIVEGLEGEVEMFCDLNIRFGYGKRMPWIEYDGKRATLIAGHDGVAFFTGVPLEVDRKAGRIEAVFKVRQGVRVGFSLEYFATHLAPPPKPNDVEEMLVRAERFWSEWAAKCTYKGRWRDAVMRSLLTLKALTYAPSGGIVAAATTSIPEELQNVRNWDYRYCWLRDSTLTLDALMGAGYMDEALAWRGWLMRVAAGAPEQLQIMYGVAGEDRLTEIELPWLAGYEQSRPVRIGNGAYDQFQLDIYGETLNALYDTVRLGLPAFEMWDEMLTLVDFVEKAWQRPDEGIWEIRGGGVRHFTHSKVMAWVAVDRMIRLYEEFGIGKGHAIEKRIPRWRALRETIRNEILTRAYNPRVGAFTQSYDSDALDASVLLIPHMGFLPATDPRMLSTVAAIEKGLTWDGLVLRYATETGVDGLPGHEATFLICTFWLADNYAMSGRLDDAAALLDRCVSLCTPLGLLAEEYHPALHRQLGNFPQAFSHIGLITTAYIIEECAAKLGRTVPARRAA